VFALTHTGTDLEVLRAVMWIWFLGMACVVWTSFEVARMLLRRAPEAVWQARDARGEAIEVEELRLGDDGPSRYSAHRAQFIDRAC